MFYDRKPFLYANPTYSWTTDGSTPCVVLCWVCRYSIFCLLKIACRCSSLETTRNWGPGPSVPYEKDGPGRGRRGEPFVFGTTIRVKTKHMLWNEPIDKTVMGKRSCVAPWSDFFFKNRHYSVSCIQASLSCTAKTFCLFATFSGDGKKISCWSNENMFKTFVHK